MGKWTSVSKLSAVLETGLQQGEARDHIGVVISIQPTDDDGNPVDVASETLYKKALLIDYVDESLLSSDTKQEWYYKQDTKFSAKTKTPQIKYIVYRSATPDLRTRSFGIQVTTESGTLLYSSLNGTYHSSVLIRAS